MLAHDDTIFVVTLDIRGAGHGRVHANTLANRRAFATPATAAVERMVDRSESKAAADKFIREFMKGER